MGVGFFVLGAQGSDDHFNLRICAWQDVDGNL
jgi:hypothetical protein